MKHNIKGYFLAIISGVLYGAAPIMVLDIVDRGITTSTGCLMMRYAATSLILLPVALRAGKGLSKPHFLGTVAAGLLMAATAASLYTSYRWLPAGTGMAISYLYPLVVGQAGRWLYRITYNGWIRAAEGLFLVGMLLLSDISVLPEGAGMGLVFALASALSYAGLLLWEERRDLGAIHPIVFTELLSITCAVCMGCFNLTVGPFFLRLTASAAVRFAMVGVVGALATATQLAAVKQVGAMTTSLLGTLELVVCCLGSAVLLRDPFTWKSIAGTILILAAVILVTVRTEPEDEDRPAKETGGARDDI